MHELTQNEAVELVFVMLARLLSDLYWVLVSPETTSFPSWRLNKLKSQANKFGKEKLKVLIKKLAKLDIQSKTSVVALEQSLDLFILKELE